MPGRVVPDDDGDRTVAQTRGIPMYSLELSRAIAADRERQVERELRHRRLLELFATPTTDCADEGSRPGGLGQRSGPETSPALRPAR
jgi:hypothetical protein